MTDKCYQCNIDNCKISNDSCKCDICNGGYYLNDNYQCANCADLNCKDCPNGYNKLIIGKNKCTNDCTKNADNYIYEYNNTCYQKCPNNTYVLEDTKDYKCLE